MTEIDEETEVKNFESALITAIIDGKDIRTVIKNKITQDFFFTAMGQAAWRWLVDWYENPRYPDTPSWESFLHAFPAFVVERIDESIEVLCDQVRSNRLFSDIAGVVQEVSETTTDDPLAGFSQLKTHVSRLTTKYTVDNAVDVKDKIASIAEDYSRMSGEEVKLKGRPYHWKSLNDATLGAQGGQLIIIYGRPKTKKAQPISEPVLTPHGWREIGSLKVGDFVIGSDGKATQVMGVYPQGVKKVFKITTSDGASTRACDEHLWFTTTHNEQRRGKPGYVRTTQEILDSLEAPDGRDNHRLPLMRPALFAPLLQHLPLDPYLLGALLGDGSITRSDVTFTNIELDVMAKVKSLLPDDDSFTDSSVTNRAEHFTVRRKVFNGTPSNTANALKSLGLLGDRSFEKFIPKQYLMASVRDRLELLRGLADTDGWVDGGKLYIATSSPQLREDIEFLAGSLGAIVKIGKLHPKYRHGGEVRVGRDSYVVGIRFVDETVPVSSERNLDKWRYVKKDRRRTIRDITPDGEEECVCIAVDAKDSLYVTNGFIVTHNTWCLLQNALSFHESGAIIHAFSQELTSIELIRRYVALSCKLPYSQFMKGELPPMLEDKFFDQLEEFAEKEPFIVDALDQMGEGCLTELQAKIDDSGANVVIIDGAHNLGTWKDLYPIIKGLKRIAKQKDIPIIITTHQKRATGKDGSDAADDFAHSDAFFQECDVAIRITADIENLKNHEVVLYTSALREGQPVMFAVNTKLAYDMSEKRRIPLGDEGSEPDYEEAGNLDDGEDQRS